MPVCILALGGNSGNVHLTFSNLFESLNLDERISLTKTASFIKTRAVGAKAGASYLNSAIEIETDLPAVELLDVLESIERDFGRNSKGDKSTRSLDLDLIFYGQQVLSIPRLVVPHAACWYRRFVLDPVCEIAPEFHHPVKGVSVSNLRERLNSRPFRLGIAGAGSNEIQLQSESIQTAFPQIEFSSIESINDEVIEKQTIIAWLGDEESSTKSFSFEELPKVSRLDLSKIREDRTVFLKDVLASALGL